MKHGLKSLVLCVILAMLCAGLLVGTALAEDISLRVKVWNEEENDFVLSESNEITVQTCEEFVLVAQTPSGTQYSINGIDEWSWEDGEGEVSHSIATKGVRKYYLSYYDADNGEWVMLDGEDDPKVVVTPTAENGDLDAPELDGMPVTVSATAESFSFSFKEISGATLYNPWVVYAYPDEEDVVLCDYYSDAEEEQEGFEYDEENGVYTVTVKPQEGVLVEGGWVIAYVWVEGPGYNAASVEHGVPVVGETVGETWLTIENQSEETVEAQSREPLKYHVAIRKREGKVPTRAQIFMGEWNDIGAEGVLDFNPEGAELGDLSFECDWLESGEYDILVRAAWEGEDGEEKWYYGNVVHVSVTGDQIKAPEVSLKSNSVTRGVPLEVTFDWDEESIAHVKGYHVRLFDGEGEECFFEVYEPAQTIHVPTANLEEDKEYRLDVWFGTEPGYDSRSTEDEIMFSVGAGEDAVFTVDKNVVETWERFILSAYVPNAGNLRIVNNYDEVRGESEGDSLYVPWDFDHAGDYKFTLQQPDGEDWTAVEGVDPITVTVKAVGEIDEPTISLPVVVTKTEEDVPFTVTVEAHPYEGSEAPAPYINVEIWPNGEDVEKDIWHEYDTTERAFSLPMDKLEVGSYRINVYAWLKGYDCCGHEEQFEVIEAPEAGAPTMRLTVNDQEESVEVQAGADYKVAYAIDGDPEQYSVQALYLMWDGGWQQASNAEDEGFYFVGDEWGGTLNWSDNSVQRKLVMKATLQGEDEPFDIYSNEVVLNVTAEGQVPKPEVTLEGLGDGAIAQGGDITVKVTLPEENRDKITMIDLNLFSVNGEDEEQINGIRLYSGDPGAETMTRAIPTNGLEPGSYRVQVWVGAEVGYDCNETDYDDESLRFEVTERAEDAPASLSAGVSEVTVGETFLLSGYVPNANGVALFVSMGDDNWLDRTWENTDSFNTDYTLDRAGDYEFTLGVWDAEKEDWVKLTGEGTSVTITGTSKGQLAPAEITAADIFAGEDFTFSFKPVENANEGYFVRVYADVENGWDEHVLLDEYYEAGNVNGPMTLEIPAKAFEGYDTDTAFIVFVEARGVNYDWSQSEERFALRADSAFGASTVEANVGETITLTASVRGASQLKLTRNGEAFDSVVGSIGSFEITEGEPGVYTYALTAEGSEEAFAPIEIVVTHEGSVENLENLATLELPEGLEAIAEEAFSGTNIESVIIHDEVTRIEARAFANCKNLQYVFIPASVVSIAEDAFSGCDKLVWIERVKNNE